MELINYCLAKLEVLRTVGRDERGVTALEYGLIAAFIAVAIIAGVTLLGNNLGQLFNTVAGRILAGNVAATAP